MPAEIIAPVVAISAFFMTFIIGMALRLHRQQPGQARRGLTP